MSGLQSTTLRIGDAAPPLALPDLDGKEQYLFDILAQHPVLVVFAPGSWSPNTRQQAHALLEAYGAFQERGISVLMVVTEDPRTAQRLVPKDGPMFPVLIDEDRDAARDYGVYRAFSLDGLRVTRPAAFLIDQEGVLRFVYVGQGDRDVADVPGLLRLCTWLLPQPSATEAEVAAVEVVPTEEEEGLDALATMAVQLAETDTRDSADGTEILFGDQESTTSEIGEVIVEEDHATDANTMAVLEEAPGTEADMEQDAEPTVGLLIEDAPVDGFSTEAAPPRPANDEGLSNLAAPSTPVSNGDGPDSSEAPDGKETALSGQGTG